MDSDKCTTAAAELAMYDLVANPRSNGGFCSCKCFFMVLALLLAALLAPLTTMKCEPGLLTQEAGGGGPLVWRFHRIPTHLPLYPHGI
jgi:hypothetical protein